jgi:hypothetical protein
MGWIEPSAKSSSYSSGSGKHSCSSYFHKKRVTLKKSVPFGVKGGY